MLFYKIMQILLWIPLKICFPTKVIGKNNLPKGGAIYVCNHQTNYDVFILGINIWRSQVFVAKKELFKNPFIKLFLNGLKAIPIDREKPELSSIKRCLKTLEEDKVLTIFPQGTRKADNSLEGSLKGGAIMFSAKTKKPIVPMWIEKRPKFFRFNTLRIGKPFYLDFDKKLTSEDMQIAEEKLIEALKELQG